MTNQQLVVIDKFWAREALKKTTPLHIKQLFNKAVSTNKQEDEGKLQELLIGETIQSRIEPAELASPAFSHLHS